MASPWDQLELNGSVLSLPLAPPRSTPQNLPFAQPCPKVPSLAWPCLCLRRVMAASTQAEDHCLGTLPGSGVPRKLEPKSPLAFYPRFPRELTVLWEGGKRRLGLFPEKAHSPPNVCLLLSCAAPHRYSAGQPPESSRSYSCHNDHSVGQVLAGE